jgi:hypothetical protein
VARMLRFILDANRGLLRSESRGAHKSRVKHIILQAVSLVVLVAAGAPLYGQQSPPLVMKGLGFATPAARRRLAVSPRRQFCVGLAHAR